MADPRAPLHSVVIGTAGPDRLVGTPSGEVFTGGAGDDVFVWVPGGTGHDAEDVISDFGARYASASFDGGVASGTLSRAGKLDFLVNLSGLDLGGRTADPTDDVTSIAFRLGGPGETGPVLFGVVGPVNSEREADTSVIAQLGVVKGQWDAQEGEGTTLTAQLGALAAGRVYVEIRTAGRPNGEIRGQFSLLDEGRDRIDLSAALVIDFAELTARTADVGGSAHVTLGTPVQPYTLALEGLPKAMLTAADFVFASAGAAALRSQFSAIHFGRAPAAAEMALMADLAARQVAGAAAAKPLVDSADADTAVAVQAYQFFTGRSPTADGLAFLTNSDANPTDLNDAYYARFNLENRYINFAANLGIVGEGAAAFATAYGGLDFTAAVRKAYGQVIGANYAAQAGIDTGAAVVDIASRQAYFQAIAAPLPAQSRDLGAKAAMIGYLMAEGIKADVGAYAIASNAFMTDLLDGSARTGVDLVGVYAPSAPTALS